MNDLVFARSQMGMSLAFHIIFAIVGMAMPVLMVIAEVAWYRTGQRDYLDLARRWSKGTAVLFAVGAVSGTVLSFELGLLFPRFMAEAGPVIGMPFSLEGFAFFTEAIFLGIYLYGWDRVSPRGHLFSGVIVSISGVASAAFVLVANAWMNVPRGFRMEGGRFVDIHPFGAMATPFAIHEILHMVAAAYAATGFAVAGIHAWSILRGNDTGFHRRALTLGLAVGIPFALMQPLLGDFAGKQVARYQPLKLAAMERLESTQAFAPIRVGPVKVPGALSWIAYGDRSAVVRGLEEWPRSDWPHPAVRWAFQGMVGLGTWMAAVSILALYRKLSRVSWSSSQSFLWILVVTAPMGFVATELGWMVTELGRQPWIIYGILRTSAAVTPMPGLIVPFALFTVLYLILSATVLAILRSQVRETYSVDPLHGGRKR